MTEIFETIDAYPDITAVAHSVFVPLGTIWAIAGFLLSVVLVRKMVSFVTGI